ncbi:MAG: YfiR family protein [Burkholderiales bacterium]
MTLLTAMLVASVSTVCWGQVATTASESQVKAAFLYRFLGFVEWPAQAFERADSPLVIGVLGADALADELEAVVAERVVRGHPVEARKIRRGDSFAGLHVLFVGQAAGAAFPSLISASKGGALLAVTESEEALAQGSMINFVVVDNKVRFDVAPGPAELRNLKISSRLLTVARRVLVSPS